MIILASSLSLLAIVAGMFLYAKTLKENLNQLFKIVSYFIIIVGFINLFVGSAALIIEKIVMHVHHYKMEVDSYGHHEKKMKKNRHKNMSCDGMNMMGCGNKSMNEHCSEMGMMEGNDCEMGMMMKDKDCCSSMMNKKSSCMKSNMMMKKDSLVLKK
jgi:hypothetical protein